MKRPCMDETVDDEAIEQAAAQITDPQMKALLTCLNLGRQSTEQKVEAVHGQLAGFQKETMAKFDRVDMRLTSSEAEMRELKGRVTRLEAREDGTGSSSGQSFTGGTSRPAAVNPYSQAAAGKVPLDKRREIVLGFPEEMGKEDLEKAAHGILDKYKSKIEDVRALGMLAAVCKVQFATSGDMWGLLKDMKSKKFSYNGKDCWHNIDKDEDERDMAKKIGCGVRELKAHLSNQLGVAPDTLQKVVKGDYTKGLIFGRASSY